MNSVTYKKPWRIYKTFYPLFSHRCGSKTDEQSGEDRKGRPLKNQRIRRNGTNRRKRRQRNQTRAKVMWSQTADSAKKGKTEQRKESGSANIAHILLGLIVQSVKISCDVEVLKMCFHAVAQMYSKYYFFITVMIIYI